MACWASHFASLYSSLSSSLPEVSHFFFTAFFHFTTCWTSSFHHHVSLSAGAFFPDVFPNTSSAALRSILLFTDHHSWTRSVCFQFSRTFCLNSALRPTFFSFHHQIFLTLFVLLFFNIVTLMLNITNRCWVVILCPFPTRQSLMSFKFALLQARKSIWLTLPPLLYVTSWFLLFSKKVFSTTISCNIIQSKILCPSLLFSQVPHPPCHLLIPSLDCPTCLFRSPASITFSSCGIKFST